MQVLYHAYPTTLQDALHLSRAPKVVMVSLNVIRASNAKISTTFPPGLVAVFTGATSGIGESTLKEFCRQTTRSHVYLVGRNQEAADRIMSQVKNIQPEAETTFIKKDLTLLKNVDEVCEEIKAKEKKLNLLFMTQGTMSMKGRDESSEGLDRKLTTNYYSRMRFTQQLLPLLRSASPQISRVVSVLGAGEESAALELNNLDLKTNFSLSKAAKHTITMTSFAFEEMAKENPDISFIHSLPGLVKTGYGKDAGFVISAAFSLLFTLGSPWMVPIKESGERHLYAATSASYPARSGLPTAVSIGSEGVMKGSAGEIGSGAYLIGSGNEFRANEKALSELRSKGAGPTILEHTLKTFKAVRGS